MPIRPALLLLACLFAASFFTGCKKEPPREAVETFFTHTITYPGETLTLISQWYTGDAANWKILMELNGIASPTALRIGQTLAIPQGLIIREGPLPKSMVEDQARPRPAATQSPPEQAKPMTPSQQQTEPHPGPVPQEEPKDAPQPPTLIIAPPR